MTEMLPVLPMTKPNFQLETGKAVASTSGSS